MLLFAYYKQRRCERGRGRVVFVGFWHSPGVGVHVLGRVVTLFDCFLFCFPRVLLKIINLFRFKEPQL